MKKIAICVLSFILVFVFAASAFAINYSISFTLTPSGPSKYDGYGVKGDPDTNCYITTTGGTGVTQHYKLRGKRCVRTGDVVSYTSATTLGSYNSKITRATLSYMDPYKTQIKNGNYAQYEFALACSLHSGTGSSYTIVGRWNP